MTFSESDATRIISALEARMDRKVKNGAQVQTTWGEVMVVDTYNKEAEVAIYADDSGGGSEGFRIPEAMYLTAGDIVKVAINYATAERWVEEALFPAATYKKFSYTLDGILRWGDGTGIDVDLYRGSADMLATTNNFSAARIRLTSTDDVSLSSTLHPFQIGPTSGANIAMDQNEIEARNNGAASILHLNADGGGVAIANAANPTTGADGLTIGGDTNLYRLAANTLATDDQLRINSASGLTAYNAAYGYLARLFYGVETQPRFMIGGSVNPGQIAWGDGTSGADTTLYRSAANQLKTDDAFIAGLAGGGAAQIQIPSGTAGAGITFGGDTTLYRSAANVLKTDDSFYVSANLTVIGGITGIAPVSRTYYNGSSTWTKPTNLAYIVVEVQGGGGGGGGCDAGLTGEAGAAGGGGGGGYARKVLTAANLASASSLSVVAGAAGAGATAGANAGGTGGQSTVSGTGITTIYGYGGAGGGGSTCGTARALTAGGSGGTSSGGDFNAIGSDGHTAVALSGGDSLGAGHGGSSHLGGGGRGPTSSGTGLAGKIYGGGGAGSYNQGSTSARAGAAGAAGVVVITEFYGP